ncbi:MAG: lysylphosphatidylglycerol synthase transmembrane domain-containing protein [Chloroflexota bacterium]
MAEAVRPRTRLILIWAGVAVTVLFGWIAIRDVHARAVWEALKDSNYAWTIPATLALAVAVVLRAVRWQYVFERATRPPFGPTLRALLVGYLFNNLLPLRAGEAVRVVVLHSYARTSRAESAATVVAERIYDVLTILVLFFCTLPWLPHVARIKVAVWLSVLVVAGIVAAAVVLIRWEHRPIEWVLRPVVRIPFLASLDAQRLALSATQGLASLRRGRLAAAAFVLTLLSWFALALSAWFVMLAFDLGLSPAAGALVVVATGLASILPSSPAGLGVFEGATVVALGAYGVARSDALSYALVLHAVNFFPYLIAGAVALRWRS